ncbi:MAG: protein kinase [Proteobacteria bacterium]|nr:protein kinase [Pseudomonadota bacterium]
MFECPRCKTGYDDHPAFCGVCGTKIPGNDPIISPQADPLIGMVIDNRYRIIDLIGRGGMGAVYRVEHVKMGKIMALKILHGELSRDTDLVRRFKREAQTVSRLGHINTVSVFDFGAHQGMMYLVMEYIDGQDLAQALRAKGPLQFPRTARILIQVCSALHEAHDKSIVHRDLKPENILIGHRDEQDDFVKVLDFGLAKLRDKKDRTRITAKGSLVGTPYYMAPEHIRGELVDQRSDIYALGAVMFKLLTGETPFTADTPMGVITKHLTEEPEPPSKRHPRLKIPVIADEIVLKAMNKGAENRYESAEEMRTALADALESVAPGSGFRHFSSHGEPSWNLGKAIIPPTTGWDAGALAATVESAPAFEKAAENQVGGTGQSNALSKSIIIGTRQVAIGTKSDFIQFEQGLKRKRIAEITLGIILLIVVVAAAVLFVVRKARDDSNPGQETEPNDTPGQADTLVANVSLKGYIVGSNPNGDIDWYRLPGPGIHPWVVVVEVTGVPGLDMALQLVDPTAEEPLATANRTGQGKPERIAPTVINRPDAYLMIQEVRAPGIPPGAFGQTPYQLLYKTHDASNFEIEPNNTTASATPIQVGSTINGNLGPEDSVDWYCSPAGIPVKTVQVTGIPGMDISLTLQLGPEAKTFQFNSTGPGKGEGATLPAGPGPSCVSVETKPTADSGTDAPEKEGDYQILFQ